MLGPLPPPIHGSAMMTRIIKESTYINERVDLDWVNLSTSRKIEEIGQHSFTKIIRFASSYLKTFFKLLTSKYDVCYIAITCHGTGFLKDAPFVLLCKLFGHKVILHHHNKGMSKDIDRPFFRWLLKKVYSDTRVILLSWRLYPDIEKIVNRNQVRICPNGIPEISMQKKRTNVKPKILFLSNLLESKGVITMLDACKLLNQRGYDFECRFIGGETIEIDTSRFIKERDSRNLEKIVFYGGRKIGNEKNDEFSNADIFVLPTNDDCFPLVLLEAMQHALPVISTDVGGIVDLVEDGVNGIIISPKNPIQLADAIAQLLDSPEKREKLGKNGKDKYCSNYTLRNFEENMLDNLTEQI